MAELAEALYTRLTAFAGLAALIGTRAYPSIMPQGAALPALTFNRIGADAVTAGGNPIALTRARVEVSAWAESYDTMRAVAAQVRLALERTRATVAGVELHDVYLENELELYEDETRRHRALMDFFVWYR